MAGSRGLNPRAPAYIPLSYTTQTPFTNLPPLPPYIHLFTLSSPPPPPPPPPPPSFFPTASQSPLLHPQSPLYTTPYLIHPPHPPPPRVVEPSVGPEMARIGGPRRRHRAVTSCGSRGTSSGFRSSQHHHHHHHRKEPNFGRRFNSNNNKFGNSTSRATTSSSRNWERRRGSTLKKYEVLPLSLCEEKTTVMIKNIPKLYNGELLLKFLDEHCLLENQKRVKENRSEEEDHTVSAFDFMYLPMDFRSGCNRGFAFVNFTEAAAVWKFLRACNRKTWDLFQSPKIRDIVCAKIQGKEALVKHFARSTFHCESDEFLPVCFSPARDGSGTELVEETRIGKRMASTTPNV